MVVLSDGLSALASALPLTTAQAAHCKLAVGTVSELIPASRHLQVTSDLIRYMAPANMLGLPGLSLPVGVSSGEGGAAALPLGLQLMAAPWREATLLRAGAALEAALPAAGVVMPQPQVHINPLAGSS